MIFICIFIYRLYINKIYNYIYDDDVDNVVNVDNVDGDNVDNADKVDNVDDDENVDNVDNDYKGSNRTLGPSFYCHSNSTLYPTFSKPTVKSRRIG